MVDWSVPEGFRSKFVSKFSQENVRPRIKLYSMLKVAVHTVGKSVILYERGRKSAHFRLFLMIVAIKFGQKLDSKLLVVWYSQCKAIHS